MKSQKEILDIIKRVDAEFVRIFNARLRYEIIVNDGWEATILVYWQGGRLALPILSNHSDSEAVVFLVNMIAKNIKKELGVDKLSHKNAEEISIDGKKIHKDINRSEKKIPYKRRNSDIFNTGEAIPEVSDVK